jgi:hypothetical protein
MTSMILYFSSATQGDQIVFLESVEEWVKPFEFVSCAPNINPLIQGLIYLIHVH